MECINFNNRLIFIKKNLNENHNMFINRCWFIVDMLNSNKNLTYEEIINLSNIYSNKKIGCSYNI
jgi:hypothetical protein